jgi:hypothetical protein
MGMNLSLGTIEIWKSSLSQKKIVQLTRTGIKRGKSLRQIKKQLPLQRGPLPPRSVDWANLLLGEMGADPTASLRRPFCAVFVKFKQWQIETPPPALSSFGHAGRRAVDHQAGAVDEKAEHHQAGRGTAPREQRFSRRRTGRADR